MPSLADIEAAAKTHAKDRENLTDLVANLNDQIEAIKRKALPCIKRCVAQAAETKAQLNGLIDQSRDLFVRPRTVVFHGLKLGFRKAPGGIDWDDDARTAELIEKHFTKSQADLLIKTTKKPIAKALADLDAADLRKIACRIEDTGDVIVIAPVDSAVDELVAALLKDAVDDAQDQASQAA